MDGQDNLRRSRVLLVDRDPTQRKAMAKILQPLVGLLDTAEALGALPPDAEYDLLGANYDEMTVEERAELIAKFSSLQPKTRLLLFSAGKCKDDFAQLFGNHALTNLLAKNGEVDAEDLIVTVQKILRRDVFGIEKYFIWGVQPITARLSCSSEKEALLAQAEAFAKNLGVHSRLTSHFRTVADELISNALYNAPRDAEGKSRHSHLPRADKVTLQPGEEIVIKFCCDGQRLGIAAIDPFGSLTQERLLDYLAKCFRHGKDTIQSTPGGAGVGLYYMFEIVSHLVANISPGKRTEMIGLIDIGRNYRDFAGRSKSFNIFMGD
jgi:hypothetical protein